MIYHYHASSITTIYLYLSKAFYNHPFNHLFLSIYLSIDLSYPIPSYPVLPILLGSSEKKTAILLQVVTSHLIPPRPLDQCWLPHPNRNGCFWRPFQAKRGNNIELGEGGTQVSSQWAWQDGCIFWRTRYLSYLAYLYYVSYLSDLSFLFYLTYLSYLSLSLYRSICLPIYIFIDYLFCILTVRIYLNYQPI